MWLLWSCIDTPSYASIYRWVPVKADFLGAWKSVRLKHYPAYRIIITSLIIQRNLATKIRAKRESGLTAVRLKRDPPVIFSGNASSGYKISHQAYGNNSIKSIYFTIILVSLRNKNHSIIAQWRDEGIGKVITKY